MKNDINLLQGQGAPKITSFQITFFLQRLATIFGVIFLVIGLISGGYILLKLNSINNIKAKNEETSKKIASLEKTEQQFVLVRDRVDKVKGVFAEKSSDSNLLLFNTIATSFSPSVVISEAEVRSDNIKLSLSTVSSKDLIDVFTILSNSDAFSLVELENFSFNQAVGYVATIRMTAK